MQQRAPSRFAAAAARQRAAAGAQQGEGNDSPRPISAPEKRSLGAVDHVARMRRHIEREEPSDGAERIDLLEWHLARCYARNAKRDGWRPSELAMSLAEVPATAERLLRSSSFRKMPVDELRRQVIETDAKHSA